MDNAIRLLCAALAAYRVTHLVVTDDGPWDILLRARSALGVYDYGSDGRAATNLGRLLGCPHCLGMYVSLVLAALVIRPTAVGDMVLIYLGIAGLQSWLSGRRDG